MSTLSIIWNGLYTAQWIKQAEVAIRIQAHYVRMKMKRDRVVSVEVWCVPIRLKRPRD
jgi:hypothetical protein